MFTSIERVRSEVNFLCSLARRVSLVGRRRPFATLTFSSCLVFGRRRNAFRKSPCITRKRLAPEVSSSSFSDDAITFASVTSRETLLILTWRVLSHRGADCRLRYLEEFGCFGAFGENTDGCYCSAI